MRRALKVMLVLLALQAQLVIQVLLAPQAPQAQLLLWLAQLALPVPQVLVNKAQLVLKALKVQ